jgi:hypothetical protein
MLGAGVFALADPYARAAALRVNGYPQQHGQTMLLNNPHCHTHFIKISRFVLTFSTPTEIFIKNLALRFVLSVPPGWDF